MNGKQLKDVTVFQKIWMALLFIFSPFHLSMISIVMILTFATSPAVLDVSFKVDFFVFCAGLILPLTVCISFTQQRKDQAVSNLALIKTEIRTLRTIFQLFDKKKSADGKVEAETQAEPLLRSLIHSIICMCRNDQANERLTTIWKGYRKSMNAAAHHVADRLVQLSTLLGKVEADYPATDFQKNCWPHIFELSRAIEGLKAIRATACPTGFLHFNYTFVIVSSLALVPYWNSYCADESRAARFDVPFDPSLPIPSVDFSTVDFSSAAASAAAASAASGLRRALGLAAEDANATAAAAAAAGDEAFAENRFGCTSGYFLAGLYTVTALMLHSVQYAMEDPFDGELFGYAMQGPLDGEGKDDVRWEDWCDGLQSESAHPTHFPTPATAAAVAAAADAKED